MKKFLAFAIALILLLAAVGAAQAQDEIYIILFWHDAEYTVAPDDTVYVTFGWYACNPGLLKAVQNALDLEIAVDGEPFYQMVKKDPYWGAPFPPVGPVEACIPDLNATPTQADWIFPLDLSQFELDQAYEISYILSFDHQVVDGYDGDGDGIPDFYYGQYPYGFTLTVTESP